MVVQKVVYQCGCGYRTDTSKEAMEHVRKTGHSITVNGTIEETERKSR